MTPFTTYLAFINGEPRLIDAPSLPVFAGLHANIPGLRIIRVQDDVRPTDVTEDVLAGVMV